LRFVHCRTPAIAAAILLSASLPAAAQIANSVTEFSGTQGQNSWNYGFYDRTNDAGGVYNALTDFQLMTQFDGTTWKVQNGTFWTFLSADTAHPNGTTTSGGRLPVEQWAIRRYTSEVAGTINISGTLAKVQGQTGGNGVTGRIFVDGVEVFTQNIAGSDTTGVNYSFNMNVSGGSLVDFALDPLASDDLSDSTRFTAVINTVAAPEAGTGALLLMGVLSTAGIAGRRRRCRRSG
jgi:hypothetical protein